MRPVLLSLLLLLAPLVGAATYLVPSDAELIQRSDDVVVATATGVHRDAARTRYTLVIDEVLKGKRTAGQQLELTELGGTSLLVPGAPHYEPGVRYLVFTEGESTFGMGLGRFELVARRAVRDVDGFDRNWELHTERDRDAAAFLGYIRALAAQRYAEPAYWLDGRAPRVASNATGPVTRASYLLSGAFRWEAVPDAQLVLVGDAGAVYDEAAAAARGVEEWNGTESNINYAIAGTGSALGGLQEQDGVDAILLGDPNNEVLGGVVASGGAWGGHDYTFDGEAFVAITEVDIVFNHPFTASAACFNTVMTHEMGHTLGIRHSNKSPSETGCQPPADCTTDAIMRAEVSCGLDGHLRAWDRRAAKAVYGEGPEQPCERADIRSVTPSTTVRKGTEVTLTATATGTAPLTLQWFAGERGDESQPVGTGGTVAVTPQSTTRYWVLAKNACGDDTSAAVTVTVADTSRRRSVRS